MFNAHRFYMERLSFHIKETSRYLKYMFNGHIVIAMLFFISVMAYYYQQWLEGMPDNFPAALVIGVAFGMVASYSPIRTLLKEADIVYLLPAEHKLEAYFRDSIVYSFVIQLYIVFLAAAVLGPLYLEAYAGRNGSTYLMLVMALGGMKLFNLLASWWMAFVRNEYQKRGIQAAKLVLSVLFFYVSILGIIWASAVFFLIFIGILIYSYRLKNQNPGLIWDVMIQKDQERMQRFYRLANLFTDVPHLKTQVKKRQWLVSSLVKGIPFRQDRSFDYLYRITTLRSGDYLGMYLRLLIVGGVAIYFVPNDIIKVLFCFLFLYLTCFQMISLWQHHRTLIWVDLYPVSRSVRERNLIKWLEKIMVVQACLFAVLVLIFGSIWGTVIVLVGGILFSYGFIHGYVKKRLA